MSRPGRTSGTVNTVGWRLILIAVFVIYSSLNCSGQTDSDKANRQKAYDTFIDKVLRSDPTLDLCHYHLNVVLAIDASGSFVGPKQHSFIGAWSDLANTVFQKDDTFTVLPFARTLRTDKIKREMFKNKDDASLIAGLLANASSVAGEQGTLFFSPRNWLRAEGISKSKPIDPSVTLLLVVTDADGRDGDNTVVDDLQDKIPNGQPEFRKIPVPLAGVKNYPMLFYFAFVRGNAQKSKAKIARTRYTAAYWKEDDSSPDTGLEFDPTSKSSPPAQRAVPAALCSLLGAACLIALVVHRRLWRKHHLKFHFNVKFPRNLAVSDRDEWEVNLRDGETATICAVSDLQRPGEKQLPLKLDDRENGIRDIIRISTFPAMGLFKISSWKIEKLHPTDDKRSRQVILKRTVLTNDGVQQDEPVANEEKIDFAEHPIVRHYKVGFDEDNLQAIAIKQGDAPWHDKHYPNFKRTSILLAALGLGLLLMGPVVWAALAPPQPKLQFRPLSKIDNGSEAKSQPQTAPLCSGD